MNNKAIAKPVATTPFQTIREAVRTTGLSEKFLRKMHREGHLPHVKSGNRVLVNIPRLLELMDQMCIKG